jgi:hypothetical protein
MWARHMDRPLVLLSSGSLVVFLWDAALGFAAVGDGELVGAGAA